MYYGIKQTRYKICIISSQCVIKTIANNFYRDKIILLVVLSVTNLKGHLGEMFPASVSFKSRNRKLQKIDLIRPRVLVWAPYTVCPGVAPFSLDKLMIVLAVPWYHVFFIV